MSKKVDLINDCWVEAPDGTHSHFETGELRPTPYLTRAGRVVVSSRPTAIAAMTKRPETIEETVNRILSHSMLANYYLDEETIDEADDFDIDDDVPDPVTRYEQEHGIATVQAVDRGVVRPPSDEEVKQTRSVIQRIKDYKAAMAAKKEEASQPPKGSGEASPS